MPMASPSSSARSDGAIRTPLAVWGAVLAGPAALLALAAAGGANATAAIPLALGSGVAGYVLTRRTLNRPADPAAPTPVPAAQDHPPPFGLILET
jgi:two-component system phosphate regulon sensor histidine kinase PhoR